MSIMPVMTKMPASTEKVSAASDAGTGSNEGFKNLVKGFMKEDSSETGEDTQQGKEASTIADEEPVLMQAERSVKESSETPTVEPEITVDEAEPVEISVKIPDMLVAPEPSLVFVGEAAVEEKGQVEQTDAPTGKEILNKEQEPSAQIPVTPVREAKVPAAAEQVQVAQSNPEASDGTEKTVVAQPEQVSQESQQQEQEVTASEPVKQVQSEVTPPSPRTAADPAQADESLISEKQVETQEQTPQKPVAQESAEHEPVASTAKPIVPPSAPRIQSRDVLAEEPVVEAEQKPVAPAVSPPTVETAKQEVAAQAEPALPVAEKPVEAGQPVPDIQKVDYSATQKDVPAGPEMDAESKEAPRSVEDVEVLAPQPMGRKKSAVNAADNPVEINRPMQPSSDRIPVRNTKESPDAASFMQQAETQRRNIPREEAVPAQATDTNPAPIAEEMQKQDPRNERVEESNSDLLSIDKQEILSKNSDFQRGMEDAYQEDRRSLETDMMMDDAGVPIRAEGVTRSFGSVLSQQVLPDMTTRVMRLQDLVDRFDEHVLSMTGSPGDRSMKITLEPRNLGKITLSCREEGAEMMIEVVAGRSGVCELLRQQETGLRDVLEQHGYQLSEFDVRSEGDQPDDRSSELFDDEGKADSVLGQVMEEDENEAAQSDRSHHDGIWVVA